MKTIITSILILLISCSVTYGDSQDLEISILIFDYRTLIKDYLIVDGKIEVVHGFQELAETKYSRNLNSNETASLLSFIEKCNLAKLKKRYNNRNIADGYRVIYEVKVKGKEFDIRTYNVYHPTMISICEKINELLPSEYHMYIPSKTESWILEVDPIKNTEQGALQGPGDKSPPGL